MLIGAFGFESIVYSEGAFNTAYSVGFPVLFAFYAVLIPVRARIAATVGVFLLMMSIYFEALHASSDSVILASSLSNLTAFVIILYARILSNRSWHREFVARELIKDFVSNIVHDCGAPVAAISVGSAELRKYATDPELKIKLQQLERLTHRVKRLIKSLSDFHGLENNPQMPRLVAVDPKDLVEDTVKNFLDDPSTGNITVEVTIGKNLPYISAEYESLQMVILNLLENARKHSPNCRTIWLRLTPSRRFVWRPRSVSISIEDHGIGIPGRN